MEYISSNLKESFNNNFYKSSFLIGIFLLPSSLVFSLIFLLIAFIKGSFNRENYFIDKWNITLFISGILMVLSALMQNFILPNNFNEIWNPNLSFIGLTNWIPLFWIFWASEPYLNSFRKRNEFAIALISGTLPVLVTGFGQYFFNWTGPLKTLWGIIIWYQYPIIPPAGLSGLFNNQNYAGTWLNFVWPFCIYLFLQKKSNFFRQIFIFLLLVSVGYAAFLTHSRNAWAGLFTSLIVVIGRQSLIIIFPLLIIFFILIIIGSAPFISPNIQIIIRSLIPENIYMEFAKEGYVALDATRFEIFKNGLRYLFMSPLFGLGAAAFSSIFFLETNFWKGHSHNLIIELGISYGIPTTLIIIFFVCILLTQSFKKVFLNRKNEPKVNNLNRACWSAAFFFCISQTVDIQYFDGKISILIWILFSILKTIINEKDKTYANEK